MTKSFGRLVGFLLWFLFAAIVLILSVDVRASSLLEKTVKRSERVATGGFSKDIRVLFEFGTFTSPAPNPDEIKKLLSRNKSRVTTNSILLAQIKEVAQDPFVFEVLKTFLDGKGKLLASNSGGHYRDVPLKEDPDRSLIINVGIKEYQFDPKVPQEPLADYKIRETLVHELLHYAFDKMDAPISEVRDQRGLDHFVIEALEDRFTFFDLVRRGINPLGTEVKTLHSWKLSHKNESLTSETFVETHLSSAYRYSKFDAERFLKEQPQFPRAPLTDQQLEELESIWAFNATLLKGAALLAQERNPKKPQDAFKDKNVRKAFFDFVTGLPKTF